MNRKIIFFMLFSLSFGIARGADKDISESVTLVNNFIKSIGCINGIFSVQARKYIHPDNESHVPGGDYFCYLIFSDKYRILETEHGKDSGFDRSYPDKVEDYVMVKVEFQQLGKITQGERLIIKVKKYIRKFFCLKHKGKYLVVYSTDEEQDFSLYTPFINWLAEQSKINGGAGARDGWKSDLIKLKKYSKLGEGGSD